MVSRAAETPSQIAERLEKDRQRHANLSETQRANRLEQMQNITQQHRATESNLRRSTRLEADRANKRIQQALKSTKDREKDAHAKWKQRYKK